MPILSNIKTTQVTDRLEVLRQYPISMRKFLSTSASEFDKTIRNRGPDAFLHMGEYVKYNIQDRKFGGRNMDIWNVFLNHTKLEEMEGFIEEMIWRKEWVFYPTKAHDNWPNISYKFYNNESYWPHIVIFNRIVDPFKALEDINMIRIPYFKFIQTFPKVYNFDFSYADVDL